MLYHFLSLFFSFQITSFSVHNNIAQMTISLFKAPAEMNLSKFQIHS